MSTSNPNFKQILSQLVFEDSIPHRNVEALGSGRRDETKINTQHIK